MTTNPQIVYIVVIYDNKIIKMYTQLNKLIMLVKDLQTAGRQKYIKMLKTYSV